MWRRQGAEVNSEHQKQVIFVLIPHGFGLVQSLVCDSDVGTCHLKNAKRPKGTRQICLLRLRKLKLSGYGSSLWSGASRWSAPDKRWLLSATAPLKRRAARGGRLETKGSEGMLIWLFGHAWSAWLCCLERSYAKSSVAASMVSLAETSDKHKWVAGFGVV